jgi:hypothetical protein
MWRSITGTQQPMFVRWSPLPMNTRRIVEGLE